MVIAEAAAESGDVATLPVVLCFVAANAFTLWAVYCWITGWGNGGVRMRKHSRSWVRFIIDLGYTVVPFAISFGCATALMIALFAYEQTDAAVFGFICAALVLPTLGIGIWAFKEYFRPSKWRKVPEWVEDYYSSDL